jgi:propionyl-CoA carboxylase alpha chain
MESRLYAEDPERDFLPSAGRLVRYQPPRGKGVRIDSGVREGGEIPIYYDPMIAKLVTHASDRSAAISRMQLALDEFYLRGISHNMNFLAAIIKTPRFADGRLSTNFIAEEFPNGYDPKTMNEQEWRTLVSVAASVHQRLHRREREISGRMAADPKRPLRDWVVRQGNRSSTATLTSDADSADVVVDGMRVEVNAAWAPGGRFLRGMIDDNDVCVQVERIGVGYRLAMSGIVVELMVLSPRAAALYALMPVKESKASSRYLLAPMPGLLVSVAVQSGDQVEPGQELAVVEAMKMENVLRADVQRTVSSVLVSPGESVSADQPIMEFE